MTALVKRIGTVKTQLSNARLNLFDALEDELAARRTLEHTQAHLLSEGVEGSNEAQRRANLTLALEPEQEALEAANLRVRQQRLELELMGFEWEALKLEVRALELGGEEP